MASVVPAASRPEATATAGGLDQDDAGSPHRRLAGEDVA